MDMDYPVVKGFYKHTKTGRDYQVLALARNSETLEEVVVYQGFYKSSEFGDNPIWTRPVKEFLDTVILDGREYVRFQFTGMGGYDPGEFDD